MDFMGKVFRQAKLAHRKIVLPETEDIRIIKAAEEIGSKGYAEVILIGNKAKIESLATEQNCTLAHAVIIDPNNSENAQKYIDAYFQKRQKKGLTQEQAKEIILGDTLFFGAMMVGCGDADGMVAGAARATADTIRALLHCVGTAAGIKTISSFFAMISPKKEFGNDGLLFFADSAVNPNPNVNQLVDIAIATAENYELFIGEKPKVAMLSFSTKGSAQHPDVDKVQQALAKIKELKPELEIDGELQFDAAVIPKIGQKKAPGSSVAGNANVIIFPDLDAANIGYKIAQRLGGCEAIGPVVQGGAKPVNDLSRGCSVEDIVNVTAITASQVK